MKRSEMIEEIQNWMETSMGKFDGPEDRAAQMLLYIECLGMQPPATKEPCSSFVLKNGQYIQVEDSFIFTNKWDAE